MRKLVHLLLLLAFASTAEARDRVIIPQDADDDVVIQRNTGTGTEDILRAVGDGTGVVKLDILETINAPVLTVPPLQGPAAAPVEVNALTAVGGGAVNFPSGATGISAQITEFNVASVSHPNVTIAGGYLALADGREIATYDGSGTASSDFGSNVVVSLATVATGSGLTVTGGPKTYYLYVAINQLGSAITQTDTGRVVRAVNGAEDFYLSETASEAVNNTSYLYLGTVRTDASNNFVTVGTAATKKAGIASVMGNPTVYLRAKADISEPGNTGQIQMGHHLEVVDWYSFTVNDNLAFWNLTTSPDLESSGGTSCGGGAAICTLTVVGAVTGTPGLEGSTDTSTFFDGVDDSIHHPDAFFAIGSNTSFAAGGWFAPADWTPSSTDTLFGYNGSTSDRGWIVNVTSGGQFSFAFSTAISGGSNYDAQCDWTTAAMGFTDGDWHHVVLSHEAPGNRVKLYVDGKLISNTSCTNGISSYNGDRFRIGSVYDSGTTNYYQGRASDIFFMRGILNEEQLRRLVTRKLVHGMTGLAENQQWVADFTKANGSISQSINGGWLVHKTATAAYLDFSNYDSTDDVQLRLIDMGLTGTSVPVNTYDTGYLSAAPTFPLSHGLGAIPTALILQYEDAGEYDNLQPDNYCGVSATQINCDLDGLTIGASNKIRIIASVAATGISVPPASATETGTMTAGAQVLGGDKQFVPASGTAYTDGVHFRDTNAGSLNTNHVVAIGKGDTFGKLSIGGATSAGPLAQLSGSFKNSAGNYIRGSAIFLNNGAATTAGSETGNIELYTKPAGAGVQRVALFSSTGNVTLDAGSNPQRVMIDTTDTGSDAAVLMLRNSSKTAFNDVFKLVHGGGVTKFRDGADTVVGQIDLSTGSWTFGDTVASNNFTFQSAGNTVVALNSVGSSADITFSRTGLSPGSNAVGSSGGTLVFYTGGTNPATPFATVGGTMDTGTARWKLGTGTSSQVMHLSYGGHSLASGSVIVGFFPGNPSAGTSCDSNCGNLDNNFGFNGNSGVCHQAWDASTGATTTCASTTGSRACMCFGYLAN